MITNDVVKVFRESSVYNLNAYIEKFISQNPNHRVKSIKVSPTPDSSDTLAVVHMVLAV